MQREADQAGVDDRAHVLAALGVCRLQLVNGLTNHARQHCEKLPIASRQAAAVAAVQAAANGSVSQHHRDCLPRLSDLVAGRGEEQLKRKVLVGSPQDRSDGSSARQSSRW